MDKQNLVGSCGHSGMLLVWFITHFISMHIYVTSLWECKLVDKALRVTHESHVR